MRLNNIWLKFLPWLYVRSLAQFLYDRQHPREEPLREPTPALVIERVKKLFLAHGVNLTQIPRIFPDITLEDLSDDKLLIKKLSPVIIEKLSELFKVRRLWLEGVDNQIYDLNISYKRPRNFFDLLTKLQFDEHDFPFRVLKSEADFDKDGTHYQPYCFIFYEKIAEIDDQDIYRYYIDGSGWDWKHYRGRIQTKAMALMYWKKYSNPIAIYSVKQKALDLISHGKLFPYEYADGCPITDPSLEDYILTPAKSAVSKESEELDLVNDYIAEVKIADSKTIQAIKREEVDSQDDVIQQKAAAIIRHQPTHDLKRECIQFWIDSGKKFSQKDCAERFYRELPEERKILKSTGAIQTLTRAISEYERRYKLEKNGKLPLWLEGFHPEDN